MAKEKEPAEEAVASDDEAIKAAEDRASEALLDLAAREEVESQQAAASPEKGYFGYAPGADEDHSVTGVTDSMSDEEKARPVAKPLSTGSTKRGG